MGWSYGVNGEGREVGYSVAATCDEDGCDEKIDRGLAYVCGEMHDGNEHSCGRYFCYAHLQMDIGLPNQMCAGCSERFEQENPEKVAIAIAEFEARRAGWVDELHGDGLIDG